jgi:peptidoglycan/LPS O-acetylase OafA/YrhL
MKYRADIDGLRAIAVLAVVAFHLKAGVSGGFVGVDVFFVISGYLISTIVYSEVRSETFSIMRFYQRRALRILPALISVILVSAIFAVAAFYPSELFSFSRSAIASLFFCANIYFFAIEDYFSPNADTIPLLHIWSLGIEEQFYFLFPPLIMFCSRVARKALFPALLILFVVSLLACEFIINRSSTAAFYLLPFRAFELLLGCLLSLPAARTPVPKVVAEGAAGIGLALVMCSIFGFNSDTRFPGLTALLPCSGAALLLWSGVQHDTRIAQLLSLKPVVFLGKISYSLYLVHWPVLVFSLRLIPNLSNFKFQLLVISSSFLLASANYWFVEQPFRLKGRKQPPFRTVAYSGGALTALAACLAISPYGLTNVRSKNAEIERVTAYLTYDYRPAYRSGECFLDPDQDFTSETAKNCLPNEPGIPAVLWGDSHAIALYSGLRASMEKEGFSLGVLTASACSPISGYSIASRPKCPSFNDQVLATILSIKPRLVILSAAWIITDNSMQLLDDTVRNLSRHGIKVVLIGQTPIYNLSVPAMLAARIEAKNPSRIAKGKELGLPRMENTDNIMMKVFGGRTDVAYIPLTPLICPKMECPLATSDGTPMYFDFEHLTTKGSNYFAKMLAPLIVNYVRLAG